MAALGGTLCPLRGSTPMRRTWRAARPVMDRTKMESRAKAQYEFACRAREVELDLFWKRSLFFWGFIGAAFVAFATLRSNLALSVLIASFGFVCSFVWTLANRGSKFWYENWERKVEKSEMDFTGPWFAVPESPKPDLRWLRARRFSVSKLAIALSDYVAALWFVLLLSRLAVLLFPTGTLDRWRAIATTAFASVSILYAFGLIALARSKEPPGRVAAGRDV